MIDVTLLWYLLSFITLTLFFWNLDFVAKAFSYRLCFVIASVSVVIGSKGTCLGRGRLTFIIPEIQDNLVLFPMASLKAKYSVR